MNHLFIAFCGLLVLVGALTLVLLHLGQSQKNYLKPFFKFYLFFTLFIFTTLIRYYSVVNITLINVYSIHIIYGISVLFNYLFIFFSLLTFHSLFKLDRKNVETSLFIVLLISFGIMVSPISIRYIKDIDSIKFGWGYFVAVIPYFFILLYVISLIPQKIKNVQYTDDRVFMYMLGGFSIFGLIDTIMPIISIVENPVKRLNTTGEMLLISTIPFLVISIYISVSIMNRLFIKNSSLNKDSLIVMGFSPRESELVLLILKGYSNKKISEELCISIGTVKTHVHNIFKKADVSNRFELAKKLENKL